MTTVETLQEAREILEIAQGNVNALQSNGAGIQSRRIKKLIEADKAKDELIEELLHCLHVANDFITAKHGTRNLGRVTALEKAKELGYKP